MSRGGGLAANDAWAERALDDLRATLLDPLVESIVSTVPGENPALHPYRTRLLGEIVGNWLPVGVSSGYLPASSTEQWLSFAQASVEELRMPWVAESLSSAWASALQEFEGAEFDRLQSGDALAVALATTEDQVEAELMARVLFYSDEQWNSAIAELRDLITQSRSDRELRRVAAELPAWITDGPYRLRAEIAFVGEQLAGSTYRALRELMVLFGTVQGPEAWRSRMPLVKGIPRPLSSFLSSEFYLPGGTPTLGTWDPHRWEYEGDDAEEPTQESPRPSMPMLRIASGLEWRLAPGDSRTITRVESLREAQRPLLQAVLAEDEEARWVGASRPPMAESWTYEELLAALEEYESALRDTRLGEPTIRTYINTARRFLRQFLGNHGSHGPTAR